jgi:putative transposase
MSEAALDAEKTQGMFCSTSNPVMRPGYLKGKSSIWIARKVECKVGNFLGHKFWARGYFVSTVGRNEEMIRAYIKNQEMADKQLDQLQLKLSSS